MEDMVDSRARVKKTVRNGKVHKPSAAVMELVDMGVSKSPAGDSVRVRVPPAAPIECELSETLAYIVGVALGDGNLSNPNGRAIRLRITCDARYPQISAEITTALSRLFPKNKISRTVRTNTYFDISVYSNKLASLMPWNVGGGSKKIQHARVPDWIKTNPQFAKHCLRGLIQTDGCIYRDRGYEMINFTNNNRELAEDVEAMLLLLGYSPRFTAVQNGSYIKFTVRIARGVEVHRLKAFIGLYKA